MYAESSPSSPSSPLSTLHLPKSHAASHLSDPSSTVIAEHQAIYDWVLATESEGVRFLLGGGVIFLFGWEADVESNAVPFHLTEANPRFCYKKSQ